jgi:PhoH-like ATPase
MTTSSLPKVLLPQEIFNALSSTENVFIPDFKPGASINSFFLAQNELEHKEIFLCKVVGEKEVRKIYTPPNFNYFGIASKDARQAAFLNTLSDEEIRVSVCLGAAGTGKTTLALAYALEQLFNDNKTIYLCKPTHLVGRSKTFGPVPGDQHEKYAPHLASYEIILKKLTGSEGRYMSLLRDKKKIQFVPVEYMRGNNYEDGVFILDEVQNFDWHELKTLVSRIAESTKLIIIGDPQQIDARFRYEQSGLYQMINSYAFRQSDFTSEITLEKQYRGRIPQLVHDIDMEINKNEGTSTRRNSKQH